MHECIGAKLERIHFLPDIKLKDYKSITLNFDDGKSLCFEVQMLPGKSSISAVIKVCKGTWEMVKAAPDGVKHKPGCASFNNPPRGFSSIVSECDCGAGKAVEDMTTKELIESPSECHCLDCNLPNLDVEVLEPRELTEG